MHPLHLNSLERIVPALGESSEHGLVRVADANGLALAMRQVDQEVDLAADCSRILHVIKKEMAPGGGQMQLAR